MKFYDDIQTNPGDGWYALGNLLSKKKISGGPQWDPNTDKVSFSPYQGPKGFFGSGARQRADEMNRQYWMQMLSDQEAMKRATAEAQERNKGLVETQKLQNAGQLENTKQQGKNARREVKVKARAESNLEANKSSNKIRENQDKNIGDVIVKLGLDDTPETRAAFAQAIRPLLMQNAQRELQMQSGALNQDGAQELWNRRFAADALSQEVKNAAALKQDVGMGGVSTAPVVPGINSSLSTRPGQQQTMFGALPNQEIETYGGIPDPKTGERIGGNTVTRQNYTPASIRTPVDSAIKERVVGQQQVAPTPADNQPNSPILDFINNKQSIDPETIKMLMQLLHR